METQGGKKSLARDKEGRFVSVVTKEHTKTVGSTRKVPICRPLADLIAEVIRIYQLFAHGVEGDVQLVALRPQGLKASELEIMSLPRRGSNSDLVICARNSVNAVWPPPLSARGLAGRIINPG